MAEEETQHCQRQEELEKKTWKHGVLLKPTLHLVVALLNHQLGAHIYMYKA